MGRRFIKDPHILYEFFGDEGMIFSLNNYLTQVLNRIAFKIFDLTDGERYENDIIKIIKEEYGIDENIVREDIYNFYNNLLKKGIVHPI